MKYLKTTIFMVLGIIFIAQLGYRLFVYREEYLTKYDPNYWQKRYEASQWNSQVGCAEFDPHINPKTCVWDDAWYQGKGRFLKINTKQESIGDDGLYAYAGWRYVTGYDPTLLNAEMPPLGKYVIGATILLFRNQNIFALLSGIGVLIGIFLLGKQVLKDSFLAFLPVLFFSFEPLFYTQLRAPYLDNFYLLFLLFALYFFLKDKFYFSSIFFGLMIATKASIATLGTVGITFLIYFLLTKKIDELKKWLISLPLALIVFILTYSRYFLLGHNIIAFLKVQKWVLQFYSTGAKGSLGMVFQMFLLGQWSTWFGKTVPIVEWSILWPILFIIAIAFGLSHLKNRSFGNSFLLFIWVAVYFVFLLTVPVFSRYFLVILPFLYIIATDLVSSIMRKRIKI